MKWKWLIFQIWHCLTLHKCAAGNGFKKHVSNLFQLFFTLLPPLPFPPRSAPDLGGRRRVEELHLFLMRWVPAGPFTSCQMMLFLQLLCRFLRRLTKQIGCSTMSVFIRSRICYCLNVLMCLRGMKNKRSCWIDRYQISPHQKEREKRGRSSRADNSLLKHFYYSAFSKTVFPPFLRLKICIHHRMYIFTYVFMNIYIYTQ